MPLCRQWTQIWFCVWFVTFSWVNSRTQNLVSGGDVHVQQASLLLKMPPWHLIAPVPFVLPQELSCGIPLESAYRGAMDDAQLLLDLGVRIHCVDSIYIKYRWWPPTTNSRGVRGAGTLRPLKFLQWASKLAWKACPSIITNACMTLCGQQIVVRFYSSWSSGQGKWKQPLSAITNVLWKFKPSRRQKQEALALQSSQSTLCMHMLNSGMCETRSYDFYGWSSQENRQTVW